MERGMCKELDVFMRALKKKIAKAKASSGESLEEGKRPMSFAVYQLMCQKLLESDTADALFAHTFLVLEWNLMARSHMVGDMDVAHIEWRQDCLLFFFGKSKRNQTGEDSERPFHVYSNPLQPEICPVLALATYLLAYPDVLKSGGPLFPGSSQYSRFMKIFHKTIDAHAAEFKKLGITKGDLGSHSCRKGAITLVTTGCTVSPPMAAVCIRAGWSMGSVKDRYIHYEKAGDQFVGRTVTGIPALDCNFAISPVHWDWSGLSRIDERKKKEELEEILGEIVVKKDVSAATFGMLQYLFAALVYHYDYLNQTLDESNILRASQGFVPAAEECEELKELTVVRFPWELTPDSPKPSGIPPHVLLLNKLEGMDKELLSYPKKILDGVHDEIKQLRHALSDELDKRNIGGPEFGAKRIMEDLAEQTKDMIDDFRKELSDMKGGRNAVVNDDDFDELFTGDFGEDDASATPEGSPKRQTGESLKRSLATTSQNIPSKRRKVAVLDWQTCLGGGKSKIVLAPPDYKFPVLTLETLILRWYCGDRTKNVPPYRMLSGKDLPAMKSARHMLCMMRKVIKHVERAAVEVANRKELVIRRRPWRPKDCKALYDGVAHFFKIPGKQKRRFSQISWKTYYNMLEKRKWKLFGEKTDESATATAAAATTAARARTTTATATTAAATATTAARARTTAATATTAARRRKQTKKRAPTAPTRSSPRQKKQRRQQGPAATQNDAFGAAFAQIPARDERVENTCALGTKCKVFQEPEAYAGLQMQTHKCRGPDCDNQVHHICAMSNQLGELNDCCCSQKCLARFKRLKH